MPHGRRHCHLHLQPCTSWNLRRQTVLLASCAPVLTGAAARMGSDAVFLLCPPPRSLFSRHRSLLAAFVPDTFSPQDLCTRCSRRLENSSPPPPPAPSPSSGLCSTISFSARLALPILLNTKHCLSSTLTPNFQYFALLPPSP